jgi:hypothetical protein
LPGAYAPGVFYWCGFVLTLQRNCGIKSKSVVLEVVMQQRYIEKWTADDVAMLTVHQHDGLYGLFVGKDQVCTPAGKWVSHVRRDVIYAMLQEAWVKGKLDVTSGGCFSLYATQHDLLAESFSGFVAHLPHMLDHHEVVTRPMAGRDYIEQAWAWRSVARWLEEHGCARPFGMQPLDERLIPVLSETLLGLDAAQQTAVMSLCYKHQASVLLALMLVLGRCTGVEYADGCLIGNPRHPIFGIGDFKAYRHDAQQLTHDAHISCAYVAMMQRSS